MTSDGKQGLKICGTMLLVSGAAGLVACFTAQQSFGKDLPVAYWVYALLVYAGATCYHWEA